MQISLGPQHDASKFQASNRVALLIAIAAVLLLCGRLLVVQVVRGERYQRFAAIERVAKVRALAPRGLVKGSDGTVMAANIDSHSLEIMTNRVKPERIAPIASRLRELLDMTDTDYDAAIADLSKPADPKKRRPLVVRKDLVSTHCPYDSTALELVPETPYGFCAACGRTFEPVTAKKNCPFDQRRLVAVAGSQGAWHCPSCDREFMDGETCPYDQHRVRPGHHNLRCALCKRTFNDEVAVLRAHLHELPEARVQAEIQREYPLRFLASHVLGYMGYVDAKEMEPLFWLAPPRFAPTDRVGRSGIERAFDTSLRGIDGEQVRVLRSGKEGDAKDLPELPEQLQPRPTVPGATLRLTLDLDLQRAAKTAMKDVYAGAVVVVDVHSGAVLAMYSKPSFDPNTMSGKRTPQQRNDGDAAAYAPLLNRAVHAFAPASTFKVVAAIAGLELGVIKPNSTFHCPGYYDFGGRRFHCHSKRGHGDVTVREALRSSCDVFFYHLGEQLGLERLEEYARLLGFGEATGIEINESKGRVPSLPWYREHVKGGYFPGFALSTAVGQKDVTATPLQMARVYAGLVTGRLPTARLVAGFESQDGKFAPAEPGIVRDLPIKKSTLTLVRSALRAVVAEEGGTAHAAQPTWTTMAGKTGTAQAAQRPRKDVVELLKGDPGALNRLASWLLNDHAWFVGWAPFDEPQLAVAVFIEHGGSGGHNAAPVARLIVDSYFQKRQPKLEAPETVAPAHKGHANAQADDDTAEIPVPDPNNQPTVPDSDDEQPPQSLPGQPAPLPEPSRTETPDTKHPDSKGHNPAAGESSRGGDDEVLP